MSQKSGMGFIYIMFILFVGLFTLVILTDGGSGGNAVSQQQERVGLLQRPVLDLIVCNGTVENPRLQETRIAELSCDIQPNACQGGIFGQLPIIIPAAIGLKAAGTLVGGTLAGGLIWNQISGVDEGYVMMKIDKQEELAIQYSVKEDTLAKGKGQPWNVEMCVQEKANRYDVLFVNWDSNDNFLNDRTITVTVSR
tara:strand:- start:336 stop:923 length:588 start_codon:yes stop_codon:yes gene_type:complete